MTYLELQIQLDLNPDNRINILKNADACEFIDIGYLFVDQEDGQCYLFDNYGQKDDINKVKWIEVNAFWSCASLKSIKIPDSIECIGNWTFYHCIFLKNIKIPSSVKSIGDGAFYNCTSLASIKIPNSVESIGKWVFDGCISLKKVVFNGKTMDEVKAMKKYPFGIEDESIIKVES